MPRFQVRIALPVFRRHCACPPFRWSTQNGTGTLRDVVLEFMTIIARSQSHFR